jgi:hypothetical protein
MFLKTRWLMRFISRLLELQPQLAPAAATMAAIDAFEESFDIDPAEAAETYAAKRPYQSARPRSRHHVGKNVSDLWLSMRTREK